MDKDICATPEVVESESEAETAESIDKLYMDMGSERRASSLSSPSLGREITSNSFGSCPSLPGLDSPRQGTMSDFSGRHMSVPNTPSTHALEPFPESPAIEQSPRVTFQFYNNAEEKEIGFKSIHNANCCGNCCCGQQRVAGFCALPDHTRLYFSRQFDQETATDDIKISRTAEFGIEFVESARDEYSWDNYRTCDQIEQSEEYVLSPDYYHLDECDPDNMAACSDVPGEAVGQTEQGATTSFAVPSGDTGVKRPRDQGGTGEEGWAEDEDPHPKRNRYSFGAAVELGGHTPKYACPYQKFDPHGERSCGHPKASNPQGGFNNTSRLK
jgi:hypothetical protein